MKNNLKVEIATGEKVRAEVVGTILKVKGPKGEVERNFAYPKIKVEVADGKIIVSSVKATKNEKKIVGAFEAHIQNMVNGVTELYVYKLKICSGHFPMSVSVSGREFIIKNFLGETVPRTVKFSPSVEVKVNGTEIAVTGSDIELVGQTAAKIENLCRITNRDRRIFQDGCYITMKAGKAI